MSNVSGALSVLGQHTSAKSSNGRKAQQKRRRGADQKSILLAACPMKLSPHGKNELHLDIIPLHWLLVPIFGITLPFYPFFWGGVI